MLSIKKILEYIVNMTQNALKCESIKEQLNEHERCEPYAIFSRMDREDKGYLVKEDFIRFLKENNVNIDTQRKTIDLFIEYYDKNFDEKLDFTEFLNFILNKEQNLSRSISSQRETYKIACDEFLEKNLENLIVQTLMSDFYLFEYADMKKIEIFLNLEEEKYCNKNDEDNKLIDLFTKIDYDKDGLISCEDLYDFISKRRIKICQNELQNFIGLFDEDMDGFLDWNEFLFMILPSSSSFEYDLDSLKRQEEKYNEIYFHKNSSICCNDYFDYKEKNNNEYIYTNGNNKNYNSNIYNNDCDYISNPKSDSDINGNQYYFDYDYSISNKSPKNNSINFNSNFNNKENYCNNINSNNDYNYNNDIKIYNKKNNGNFNNNININNNYIDYRQFSELCKILYRIIDSEKNIEFLKNKLFSNNNFNLNKLFNYFDKYQNGYISLIDFQEGLEAFDINNKNSLLLFSNFDISNNGRLTKENFINIFIPLNLTECIEKNENILAGGCDMENFVSFEIDIKENIAELLDCLIEHFTYLNEISKFYEEKKIDVEYIFGVLDKFNKGYIEEEEFQNIFKYGDNGNVVSFEDLLLIMEKIDSNKDGKITCQDFVQLFKK